MNIILKEERTVRGLAVIEDLIRIMLIDAGLDHETATLVVYAAHKNWRLNMSQGVQVGTTQFTPTLLGLKVVAEGEDPVGVGLTVVKDGKPMDAVSLRVALLRSPKIQGQRFVVKSATLKEFQKKRNSSGPQEELGAVTPLNHLIDREEAVPVEVESTPPVTLISNDSQRVVSPPAVVPHPGPLIVGKNPQDLQLVLTALAVSDSLGGVFGSNTLHHVIDSGTGILHSQTEFLHMLRVLMSRGYVEKIGDKPCKYRLDSAKVHTDAEAELPKKAKPVRSRGGLADAEKEIRRLEAELSSTNVLAEQLASVQAVITARREALANAGGIATDLANCQSQIEKLSQTLAGLNTRLAQLQEKKRLVEDGQEPLDHAVQAEARLQSQLAQSAGKCERLKKLQEALSILKQLLGQ